MKDEFRGLSLPEDLLDAAALFDRLAKLAM